MEVSRQPLGAVVKSSSNIQKVGVKSLWTSGHQTK